MNILVILLIVFLLFGGVGYYGHGAGWNVGYMGGGGLVTLILVLVLLRVLGLI